MVFTNIANMKAACFEDEGERRERKREGQREREREGEHLGGCSPVESRQKKEPKD